MTSNSKGIRISHFPIRLIFAIAAIYEILIGLVLFFPSPTGFLTTIAPLAAPPIFFQFAALMLIVFGLMFATVAVEPVSQRNLIRYGLLLKLSQCGLFGYYWATTDLPMVFKPLVVIDIVLYGLFLFSYLKLGKPTSV